MAVILAENEVSIESVHALFVKAFLRAEIDSDGDIHVTEGLEFPIWLSIDEEQRLIRLFTFVSWDVDAYPLVTEDSVNHLNATIILPAFYVRKGESGKLYAHYFMSYSDGIIDSHIINLARRFSGASIFGVRQILEVQLH